MGWGQRKRFWMDVESDRQNKIGTGSNSRLCADIASKSGCVSVHVYVDRDGVERFKVEMCDWGGTRRAAGAFRFGICAGELDARSFDNVTVDSLMEALKKRLADPNRIVETATALAELLGDASLVPRARRRKRAMTVQAVDNSFTAAAE